MRIGHGFDVHAFQNGRKLVLGGVTIPYHRGLLAHSDGDVAIHALCDALLGAACLGDIGRHFPDTNAEFKDIDSRQLLSHVVLLLKERDFSINNVDITIIAQVPKLADHIEDMCKKLSRELDIDMSRVNIKATTTEKLGYIGREEGIAAHAVTLLDEK